MTRTTSPPRGAAGAKGGGRATMPGSVLTRDRSSRSSRSSAHSRAAAGSSWNGGSSLRKEFEKFWSTTCQPSLWPTRLAIDPPRAPDSRLRAMVSPLGQRSAAGWAASPR